MRVDRPSAGSFSLLTAALCAAVLLCLAAATPAGAAAQLGWSAPLRVDATPLTGVACASARLCAAVDEAGGALLSTSPAVAAAWSRQVPDASALTGVSCASVSLCVAVDAAGHALTTTNPTAGATATWSAPQQIDGSTALTGVSCWPISDRPGSLCVAVDAAGHALTTTNPTAGATATWSAPQQIDGSTALTGVSCTSGSLCVAVDAAGRVLVSNEPAGGAATWAGRSLDAGESFAAVSCAPAPAAVCVAVDRAGDVFASADPTAGAPAGTAATWSWTPALALEPSAPTAVSCTAAGLCVVVNGGGAAYVGDNPTAAAPVWAFDALDSPTPLTGVSCTAEGLCAAVDGDGRVLVGQTPPPAVALGAPSALAETTATVTGTVDPQDATLASCRFEYGPTATYGQSVPCAAGVAGTGGEAVATLAGGVAQAVSATLGGLAANASYHYRLVASGAGGAESTPDATLRTLAPPLIQPHPSITGIPARGQQLTCHSGVSATATGVTVSYLWLRDTGAIAGASAPTYTVQSADVSHHLQCRVSATNAAGSAIATSAFVAVPAGGLGSISETQVGPPRVAGTAVAVSVTCSPQAAGSCALALRLTVVETLHRGHAVAVAAARRAQHLTVTVGASGARVGAGQRRTVTVALNATGRALLARLRRLPVRLSVRGTIVGALVAPLRSATVTFTGGARRASVGRRASTGGAHTDRASPRHSG